YPSGGHRRRGLQSTLSFLDGKSLEPLERATQGLVEAGKPVDGELLQFLSPLGWEHINLTGDYVWRQSRRLEDGKFRPLRMPGKP
ncbi:Tn3 family transposase, partial [Aeromonas veronii]|uniref:Tn3 family transposase n=1 Tax=Aeromonas veronii TaxID=654 RepID=UPI003D1C80D3